MDRRIKTAAAVCLALGLAAACFVIVLTALHAVGTDDRLYLKLQEEAGIVDATGLSRDDLITLDRAMADYLAGDATACTIELPVFGNVQPVFNERETAHMADCFDLFVLLRRARAILIASACLLIAFGAFTLRDRRIARRAIVLAPIVMLLPLALLGVWAALDFDSAFTFFHHMLFTNDLWLLDPRTDLLIRVCPESMFMAMGIRIAAYSVAGVLLLCGSAYAMTYIRKDRPCNDRTTRRAVAKRHRG